MTHGLKKFGIVMLLGVSLMGCKTAGDVLIDGASPFTRGELYAYLSDKTQVWSAGGAYYSAEGTLETLWEGERNEGGWSTNNDGVLCWHVKSWGETPCETYYHNGDVVSFVYEGKTALAVEMFDGNVLDQLQAGQEPGAAEPEVAATYEKVLFTSTEMAAFVTGKTVIWGDNGGAYYASDNSLKTVWDGVRKTGTWSVDDKGGVCWEIPSWGKTPCEYHFYNGDELWSEYNGQDAKTDEYVEGDTTGSM